jgi:hypothetical protein
MHAKVVGLSTTAARQNGQMAQRNWDRFVETTPWALDPHAQVVVGDEAPSAHDLRNVPALSELIERATATPVIVDRDHLELLTWERSDGDKLDWLCPAPSAVPPDDVWTEHSQLLKHFGGVIERSSDEPSTWLLNCNDVLTERETRNDGAFIDNYLWIMEDHGGSWPVDPASYYSICREANGNTTLCSRVDGSVLLFAPDHSFDHIVPLEGCPPYSLYRIPAAPDFMGWVDAIATQWLRAIA